MFEMEARKRWKVVCKRAEVRSRIFMQFHPFLRLLSTIPHGHKKPAQNYRGQKNLEEKGKQGGSSTESRELDPANSSISSLPLGAISRFVWPQSIRLGRSYFHFFRLRNQTIQGKRTSLIPIIL